MDADEALSTGLDLKPRDKRILIRTGWVLFVTLSQAYGFGLLTYVGFASPFAKASDVDKLLRAGEVSARISMQQELRVQTRVWCTNPDADVRMYAEKRIEELRRDLHEIAKLQTPEPRCEQVSASDR
jgi:hypothetical protein